MIRQMKSGSQVCKKKSNHEKSTKIVSYQNFLIEASQNSQKKNSNGNHQTKLYTFCANQATAKKTTDQSILENQQNSNDNQKIMNTQKNHLHRNQSKSKQKLILSTNEIRQKMNTKESKKNLLINKLKQPRSISKSLNNSRELSRSKQFGRGKNININLLESLCATQLRNQHKYESNITEQENSSVIMINQQELKHFTKRFAQQRINYQENIQQLRQQLNELKSLNQNLQIEKNDCFACLNYNKQALLDIQEENLKLNDQISFLKDEQKYSQLLKQELQSKISALQKIIELKDVQIDKFREQKNSLRLENEKNSYNTKNYYQSQMALMKIELEYLSNQLQIQSSGIQITSSFLNSETQTYQLNKLNKFEEQINEKNLIIEKLSQQLLHLKEVNDYVTKEFEKTYTLKAQYDALIKTLEIKQQDSFRNEPFNQILSQIHRVSKSNSSMHLNDLENSICLYNENVSHI